MQISSLPAYQIRAKMVVDRILVTSQSAACRHDAVFTAPCSVQFIRTKELPVSITKECGWAHRRREHGEKRKKLSSLGIKPGPSIHSQSLKSLGLECWHQDATNNKQLYLRKDFLYKCIISYKTRERAEVPEQYKQLKWPMFLLLTAQTLTSSLHQTAQWNDVILFMYWCILLLAPHFVECDNAALPTARKSAPSTVCRKYVPTRTKSSSSPTAEPNGHPTASCKAVWCLGLHLTSPSHTCEVPYFLGKWYNF
jgi:hypothetical protein